MESGNETYVVRVVDAISVGFQLHAADGDVVIAWQYLKLCD